MTFRKIRDLLLHRIGYSRCFEPRVVFEQANARMNCLLELAIARQLLDSRDFFFLQIGAFDGETRDPLFHAVRKYGLKGVLVEPQKPAFERLRENYRDQPQLQFVNAAISDRNEERIMYTLRNGACTAASFDKRHLLKHSIPEADIVEQPTPCLTFPELLKRSGRENVDLLQIDAEGADFAILKMVDFEHFRPSIVRYEQLHMTRSERDEAAQRLVQNGYQLHADRMDVTALHRAA
jgi:FkbM family methyltransferase